MMKRAEELALKIDKQCMDRGNHVGAAHIIAKALQAAELKAYERCKRYLHRRINDHQVQETMADGMDAQSSVKFHATCQIELHNLLKELEEMIENVGK